MNDRNRRLQNDKDGGSTCRRRFVVSTVALLLVALLIGPSFGAHAQEGAPTAGAPMAGAPMAGAPAVEAPAAEPEAVQAALGSGFTYQGRLDDGGSPANGPYDFQFKLYDAASAGAQIGATLTKDNVAVNSGLFTTDLDFGSFPFDGQARFLELAVRAGTSTGAYTTLAPRRPLLANPYALYSSSTRGFNFVSSKYIPNTIFVEQPWELDVRSLYTRALVMSLASIIPQSNNDLWINALPNQRHLVIKANGDIGIGTETPKAKLDVAGTARADVVQIDAGADLAEPFAVAGQAKPGLVVAIDPNRAGQLQIADRAYDRTVAGVISGAGGLRPGLTLQQPELVQGEAHPVALSGRVYVWADASFGPIQPGDLLTTSGTPGHAMRVSDYTLGQGAILGKAMSSLATGRGLVLVLVSLQ